MYYEYCMHVLYARHVYQVVNCYDKDTNMYKCG